MGEIFQVFFFFVFVFKHEKLKFPCLDKFVNQVLQVIVLINSLAFRLKAIGVQIINTYWIRKIKTVN